MMSKKLEQDKYNKWDKSFSRWEDDYYEYSQEDQEDLLEEKNKEKEE